MGFSFSVKLIKKRLPYYTKKTIGVQVKIETYLYFLKAKPPSLLKAVFDC